MAREARETEDLDFEVCVEEGVEVIDQELLFGIDVFVRPVSELVDCREVLFKLVFGLRCFHNGRHNFF